MFTLTLFSLEKIFVAMSLKKFNFQENFPKNDMRLLKNDMSFPSYYPSAATNTPLNLRRSGPST